MFESLLVRRMGDGEAAIDFGALAEALLFYEVVHVHFDRSSIISLCREIGHENFLALLRSGRLRGTYIPQMAATITNTVNNIEFHDFGVIEISGHENVGRQTRRQVLDSFLLRELGSGYGVKRFIKHFSDKVPTKNSLSIDGKDDLIGNHSKRDLQDSNYALFAIEQKIKVYLPDFNLPPNWYFRPIETNEGFLIDTNFEFDKLNENLKQTRPGENIKITAALCAGMLHEVRAELNLASQYGSELMTSPVVSRIIQRKFGSILASYSRSSSQIQMFQEVTLSSGRAIGDALRLKNKSFADFMKLLEHAAKFRDWVRAVNPDIGLLTEYQKAIEQVSWVERLPTKSTRFALFTGGGIVADLMLAGGLGTAAGIGLGVADTFIVDRLIKGWKPSQFVEKRLVPFAER